MWKIDVPGFRKLKINYLVFDFNGTLAVDGKLVKGVSERLNKLSQHLNIHILTADTYSTVRSEFSDSKIEIHIIAPNNQDREKVEYIKSLGCDRVVCFGNGANDKLMLKESALGIGVLLEEGIYINSLISSDIVVKDIIDGLDLLLHPLRLVATLRK